VTEGLLAVVERIEKLGKGATTHPLILNRYDLDSGVVSWQLQFEPKKGAGEVLTQGTDEHNPRSRRDHELLCALWNDHGVVLSAARGWLNMRSALEFLSRSETAAIGRPFLPLNIQALAASLGWTEP